jgi:hypothetical protein
VVDCVDSAVAFGGVGELVLLRLLIYTDVHFEVPHLWIDSLLTKPKRLEVNFFLLGVPLSLKLEFLRFLRFSFSFHLKNSLLNLLFINGFKIDHKLDDWHIGSMDKLNLIDLTLVFQELQVVEESLHHL